MNAHLHDASKLREGLLAWVYEDALLGDDAKLTYAEARRKWGLRTVPHGMGRVLEHVTAALVDEYGPEVARGVVAYVVSADTQAPSHGWDSCVPGAKVSPEAARAHAREALRELRWA